MHLPRRRQRAKQVPAPTPVKKPLNKKAFFVISIITTFIGAILINGPNMLSNANMLPSAIIKVQDNFLAWYYDDKEWEGVWGPTPEGYVDIEEMKLSNVELLVKFEVKNGKVTGVITTPKMCASMPVQTALLEGNVSGKKVKATVFDYIGGKKTVFADLLFKREGVVMAVSPTDGRIAWFPPKTRIARYIGLEKQEEDQMFPVFCKKTPQVLSDKIRRKRR